MPIRMPHVVVDTTTIDRTEAGFRVTAAGSMLGSRELMAASALAIVNRDAVEELEAALASADKRTADLRAADLSIRIGNLERARRELDVLRAEKRRDDEIIGELRTERNALEATVVRLRKTTPISVERARHLTKEAQDACKKLREENGRLKDAVRERDRKLVELAGNVIKVASGAADVVMKKPAVAVTGAQESARNSCSICGMRFQGDVMRSVDDDDVCGSCEEPNYDFWGDD